MFLKPQELPVLLSSSTVVNSYRYLMQILSTRILLEWIQNYNDRKNIEEKVMNPEVRCD